jgi:flagellar biosynthesis protein FlhF
MKFVSIVADDAQSAIARVERELGPEAVVVSVRKLPAQGLSRLWKNHGSFEVMAALPDEPKRRHVVPENQDEYVPFGDKIEVENPVTPHPRRWKSITWLESMGLMHDFADKLERQIILTHGENPPPMPITEWTVVRNALARAWRPARKTMEGTGRPHVFIGPAGSGKTTALCKWMTAAVLREEHKVHVWRLDGDTANVAEFLTLHCEMIGVPVERFWCGPEGERDLLFIDLPGVEMGNSNAMKALHSQIAALPEPHVHLVLNAAYEGTVLFEQFHAFKGFAPEDVIFTHLDEERRRVKLWNFVLGTNCSVSFLGAGQKIPGDFFRAESTLLFPSEFRP